MSVLDGPMANVAKSLVGTFKRSATLRWYGASFYDDSTGKNSPTPTDVSCAISPPQAYSLSQIDGTLIKAGDMHFIVARTGIGREPKANRDEFIIGSQTWFIVRVMPISSGESDAAYDVHVRR